MKHLAELISVFILAILFFSCADQLTDTNNAVIDEQFKNTTLLTPIEEEGILYMRQEEKIARDVYQKLGETWNLSIFTNIASSEKNHMDAIKKLIDTYGLTDPEPYEIPGEFSNQVFQDMYDELIARGLTSPKEAMVVGQDIEKKDIEDLSYYSANTELKDILQVYKKLSDASYRHFDRFSSHVLPTE